MNTRAIPLSITASDLVSLTKPRLSTLVLVTAAGGMWLAPHSLSPSRVLASLLAIAGTVGAANALNCFIERDVDRLMARTKNRPLPAGRMDPHLALGFGISLAVISFPTLAFEANLLTALLGMIAFVSYLWVYTPLKSRSSGAMLVGAIPGALPPLMGWTTETGRVGGPGLVLFVILFFWQLPHFIAIALYRKDEYAAAGLKSLPIERGDPLSRAHLALYTTVLVLVSLLPYPLRMAGPTYLAIALVLGTAFLGLSLHGLFARLGKAWARRVFRFSLLYLPVLLISLCLDAAARS